MEILQTLKGVRNYITCKTDKSLWLQTGEKIAIIRKIPYNARPDWLK